MTSLLVLALLVALPLLLLFVALVLALSRRPRVQDHYAVSPESKSTPLGYFSMQQGKRVAQGIPGKREYFDEAPTEKMEARQ